MLVLVLVVFLNYVLNVLALKLAGGDERVIERVFVLRPTRTLILS